MTMKIGPLSSDKGIKHWGCLWGCLSAVDLGNCQSFTGRKSAYEGYGLGGIRVYCLTYLPSTDLINQ